MKRQRHFPASEIARALVIAHGRGMTGAIKEALKARPQRMKYIAGTGQHGGVDDQNHIQHDRMRGVDGEMVETGSLHSAPATKTQNSDKGRPSRGRSIT